MYQGYFAGSGGTASVKEPWKIWVDMPREPITMIYVT